MPLTFDAAVEWIRPEFGGRIHPPVVGLRPTIRFQRNVAAWSSVAWDVEIIDLKLDQERWSGGTELAFTTGSSPDLHCVKKGELIELLDAYRVIAVGTILYVEND